MYRYLTSLSRFLPTKADPPIIVGQRGSHRKFTKAASDDPKLLSIGWINAAEGNANANLASIGIGGAIRN